MKKIPNLDNSGPWYTSFRTVYTLGTGYCLVNLFITSPIENFTMILSRTTPPQSLAEWGDIFHKVYTIHSSTFFYALFIILKKNILMALVISLIGQVYYGHHKNK